MFPPILKQEMDNRVAARQKRCWIWAVRVSDLGLLHKVRGIYLVGCHFSSYNVPGIRVQIEPGDAYGIAVQRRTRDRCDSGSICTREILPLAGQE